MWFQLRPIFGNLLKDAMTKDDNDLVACAVREFVRLSLGQPADSEYGLVDALIYLDGPWYDRCDVADWFRFHDEGETKPESWNDYDWMICFATKALQNLLDDADEFVK